MTSKSTFFNSAFLKLISPIALAVALASCQPVKSEDVKSTGIYADIEVVSSSSGNVDVDASFRSSSSSNASYIELTKNDSLIASSGSVPKVMSESTSLVEAHYSASFDNVTNGAIFNVSLDRPNDISAPNTFVTMPEDMEITMPSSGDIFNTGDTLTLTWSPINLGHSLDIIFKVQCNTAQAKTFSNQVDDGLFTVLINELLIGVDFNSSNSCNVTITLIRENRGTVDSNYGKGGKIIAQVKRSLVVIISP